MLKAPALPTSGPALAVASSVRCSLLASLTSSSSRPCCLPRSSTGLSAASCCGLPPQTATACLSHPEVRALLRFRFAYLFAFHGPVLVPLLEALGGQKDPSLSVLSLGVASVAMVIADVPTGLYADRHGPKAALRLGLRLTCLVLWPSSSLPLAGPRVMASGQLGPWLPGIIGLLVLEGAIGVSLALLSGADTVLFLGYCAAPASRACRAPAAKASAARFAISGR